MNPVEWIKPGAVVYIPLATYNSSGGSVTISGFAVTDLECRKNGANTVRASDTGYALLDTDGIDRNSITGFHGASVDTSSNADAGFFRCGSFIEVCYETITCDGQTITVLAKQFRLGYPSAMLNTYIASLASQTSFTLADGPAEDDALNGMWLILSDIASGVQQAIGIVLDYTGSTKTVTLAAAPTFTIATDDGVSVMGPMPIQPTVTGRTLDVSSGGEAGVDWANVGSPTTTLNLSGTTIKTATDVEADTADLQARTPAALVSGRMDSTIDGTGMESGALNAIFNHDASGNTTNSTLGAIVNDLENGGRTDLILDAILDDTDLIDDATSGLAKIALDVAAILLDTADMQPKLGTPAASLAADVAAVKAQTAAIEADTQDVQTRVPAALTGAGNMKADALLLNGGAVGDTIETAVETVLTTLAVTDFTAIPVGTPTWNQAMGMLVAAILNRVRSNRTDGKSYIYDSDNNVIGEATISDDGTEFIRTKYTAP